MALPVAWDLLPNANPPLAEKDGKSSGRRLSVLAISRPWAKQFQRAIQYLPVPLLSSNPASTSFSHLEMNFWYDMTLLLVLRSMTVASSIVVFHWKSCKKSPSARIRYPMCEIMQLLPSMVSPEDCAALAVYGRSVGEARGCGKSPAMVCQLWSLIIWFA